MGVLIPSFFNFGVNKIKVITYYISDYGYGHATRSIAIIRFLLNYDSNIRVVICCSFALNFIKQSLRNENQSRILYHKVENDFGFILHDDSIEVDLIGMNRKYKQFIDTIGQYVRQETRFLRNVGVNLVITDISPLPVLVSKELGIPSIGISNFTWHTAYRDIISEPNLRVLYDVYNQMDYFIPLFGANEPDWQGSLDDCVDYFCREIDKNRVNQIRKQLTPNDDHYLVYFGLGMKIGINNLSGLKLWNSKNCKFVVSGNTSIEGDNVFKIPLEETETQNYVAACDLIISKPGWGTVSEAAQSRKPLIIIERTNMREDQNTILSLINRRWCKLLSWSEVDNFIITDFIKHEMKVITDRMCPVDNNMVLKQINDKIRTVLA